MTGRTRMMAALATGCLGVTMALAAAGAAAASEDDYIYDLNNHGIGGPRATLVALGQRVCVDRGAGVAASQTQAGIRTDSQLGGADAQFLYDSAVMFLC